MVGPLAHLLKNRFYVGEIAYRGEIHKGEHEPILDRESVRRRAGKTGRRQRSSESSRDHAPPPCSPVYLSTIAAIR